jgi:tetratricopeptide (TPR) repeat protein
MMNADQPLQAVPILEEALEAATTASPGAVTQQSIMLALGLALAKTLPSPSETEGSRPYSYFALDTTEYATVKAKIRIRALAYQGVGLDITASACVQAGRILLLAGDDEQAAALLNKAIELDPLMAEAYMVLGGWEEDRGLVIAARDLYRRGSEELPGNAELAGAYGITSYRSLSPQDALPLLEHAADMDTRDPYVFAFLGDCYADLGMTNQAVASYKEGLRKFPGSEPLNERLSGLAKSNRLLP